MAVGLETGLVWAEGILVVDMKDTDRPVEKEIDMRVSLAAGGGLQAGFEHVSLLLPLPNSSSS